MNLKPNITLDFIKLLEIGNLLLSILCPVRVEFKKLSECRKE